MLTLSYGYKLPETNDKGSIVFPALEDNIQQLNDHTHNGSNSSLLTAQSFTTVFQTLLSADWISLGGGNYHQTATIPAGFTFDAYTMSFRDPDGTYVYPTVTRVSNTQFDVTTNNNAVAMIVGFGI